MFGTIRLLEVADPLLAFERSYEVGKRCLLFLILAEETGEFDCNAYGVGGAFPEKNRLHPFELSDFTYGYNGAVLMLPGFSVFFAKTTGEGK